MNLHYLYCWFHHSQTNKKALFINFFFVFKQGLGKSRGSFESVLIAFIIKAILVQGEHPRRPANQRWLDHPPWHHLLSWDKKKSLGCKEWRINHLFSILFNKRRSNFSFSCSFLRLGHSTKQIHKSKEKRIGSQRSHFKTCNTTRNSSQYLSIKFGLFRLGENNPILNQQMCNGRFPLTFVGVLETSVNFW